MPRFQIYAVVLMTLVLAWAGLITLSPNPGSVGMRLSEDFSEIPLHANGWYGTNQQFDGAASVYAQLSTCQLLNRSYYKDLSGASAQLSVVLGLDLGDFHQPEVCMNGAGWQVINQRLIKIKPIGAPEHLAVLNNMRSERQGEIVLIYWFYMAGEVTPTLGSKLSQSFRNVFKTVEPSAMVKFTSPVDYDRASAEAAATDLCVSLEKDILKVVKKKATFEPSDKVLKELGAE